MDSHLEILEETLRLGHLAPTAPDTLGESASRGSNRDLPRLVWIIHAVPSRPYQVVTRFTKKTRSSWRNVPTSTSAATLPPLDPSSLKVSVSDVPEGGDLEPRLPCACDRRNAAERLSLKCRQTREEAERRTHAAALHLENQFLMELKNMLCSRPLFKLTRTAFGLFLNFTGRNFLYYIFITSNLYVHPSILGQKWIISKWHLHTQHW